MRHAVRISRRRARMPGRPKGSRIRNAPKDRQNASPNGGSSSATRAADDGVAGEEQRRRRQREEGEAVAARRPAWPAFRQSARLGAVIEADDVAGLGEEQPALDHRARAGAGRAEKRRRPGEERRAFELSAAANVAASGAANNSRKAQRRSLRACLRAMR